jgi:hypothetical protein
MNAPSGPIILFVLLVGILLHYVPLWRRQGLWFGVTVAIGFAETRQAQAGLRRYRAAVWAGSVLAVACLVGGQRAALPGLALAGMFCQPISATLAFAVVHRGTRPFAVPPPARTAPLAVTRERLPAGAASVLVPIGLIAATALYLFFTTGDSGLDRTWRHVYGPLVVCAAAVIFQLGMAQVIVHGTPRGRVAGTEGWTTRFRRATLRLLVFGTWGMTGVICALSLATGGDRPAALSWIAPLVILASTVPFAVQLVLLTRDPGSGTDGTPDECWKLGLVYFNPADPAVMVEKRFGVGYTVNFGNRALWWIVAGGVLLILLTAAVLRTG